MDFTEKTTKELQELKSKIEYEIKIRTGKDASSVELLYENLRIIISERLGSMPIIFPFFKKNNILAIIRGHESQQDGYKMHKWNGPSDFPMVITVFSAPNYCDVYGNKGAIVKFENNTLNIQQYTCATHPYHLPNFMDAFSWSLPYVCSKVFEMLIAVCKKGVADEFGEDKKDEGVPLGMPKSKVF